MNRLIAFILSWLFILPAYAQAGQSVAPGLKVQATNSTLKNNFTDKGSIFVTQLQNNAIKSKFLTIDIGANAALANSTTFVSSCPIGRACQVIAISISAQTKPSGGTNTVTIQKNGATNLLSAANFDPTTMTSNTASLLPLTGTAASLQFAATDTLTVTYVSGVQTTAAIGPSITVEVIPTAEY